MQLGPGLLREGLEGLHVVGAGLKVVGGWARPLCYEQLLGVGLYSPGLRPLM